jgi:hypothetical protein
MAHSTCELSGVLIGQNVRFRNGSEAQAHYRREVPSNRVGAWAKQALGGVTSVCWWRLVTRAKVVREGSSSNQVPLKRIVALKIESIGFENSSRKVYPTCTVGGPVSHTTFVSPFSYAEMGSAANSENEVSSFRGHEQSQPAERGA